MSTIPTAPESMISAPISHKPRLVIRPSNPRNNEVTFIRAANGMTAEVVWNSKDGLVFCIRNADGKYEIAQKCDEHKPLHWLADFARDGDVVLASTMASYTLEN